MRGPQPLLLAFAIVLLPLIAAACGSGEDGRGADDEAAGTTTIELLDARDLDVEMQRRLIRYCDEGVENVVIRAPVGDVPLERYCAFRRDANEAAAKASIRAAIPAMEAFYADHGTYAGMSVARLQHDYDAGVRGVTFGERSRTAYCVQSVVGTAVFRKTGPGAEIGPGVCAGAPVEDVEPLAYAEEAATPDDAAADAVRTAIPAIEAYYADNETYAGMTVAGLRATYDQGIGAVEIVDAAAETYCVQSRVGQAVAHKAGPASDIRLGACR